MQKDRLLRATCCMSHSKVPFPLARVRSQTPADLETRAAVTERAFGSQLSNRCLSERPSSIEVSVCKQYGQFVVDKLCLVSVDEKLVELELTYGQKINMTWW